MGRDFADPFSGDFEVKLGEYGNLSGLCQGCYFPKLSRVNSTYRELEVAR